jgi:hypothetical protein
VDKNVKRNFNPRRAPAQNIDRCSSWTRPGAIGAGAIQAGALSGLPHEKEEEVEENFM